MAINKGTLSHGATQAKALTQVAVVSCIQCGGGHVVEVCSSNQQTVYSIQNNPFSNTYNLGWRNHPNFSWGGNNDQGSQRNMQTNHSGNQGNPLVFHHQGQGQSNYQNRKSHNQPFSSTPHPIRHLWKLCSSNTSKRMMRSCNRKHLPLGLWRCRSGSLRSNLETEHLRMNDLSEHCNVLSLRFWDKRCDVGDTLKLQGPSTKSTPATKPEVVLPIPSTESELKRKDDNEVFESILSHLEKNGGLPEAGVVNQPLPSDEELALVSRRMALTTSDPKETAPTDSNEGHTRAVLKGMEAKKWTEKSGEKKERIVEEKWAEEDEVAQLEKEKKEKQRSERKQRRREEKRLRKEEERRKRAESLDVDRESSTAIVEAVSYTHLDVYKRQNL
ncbi:chromatin assembly factor 1 subunit A-like [Benincasa hispida]|uniref:chromatin assembly factor 1 subunit A-like n=1 Tax=Benincasa hispida TaxID=102211 RepID=UPI00190180B4|nr:chromatin assembly factor 1 subunit A-like [Benincasa hispida]